MKYQLFPSQNKVYHDCRTDRNASDGAEPAENTIQARF